MSDITVVSALSPQRCDIRPQVTQPRTSLELFNETRLCCETLQEIQTILSQLTPKSNQPLKGAVKQLKWSFKKPDILQMKERLESHKTAFILILTAQGTYVLS
jgi:hypothetical protein